MTTFGNTGLCKHKVVAKVCPYCEIETLRTQRDELQQELEHYRGLAMVKGADKALKDYEGGWIAMTTLEIKELILNAARAMGYEGEWVENYGECDREHYSGNTEGLFVGNEFVWNPITSLSDRAAMCDQLEIDIIWQNSRKTVVAVVADKHNEVLAKQLNMKLTNPTPAPSLVSR